MSVQTIDPEKPETVIYMRVASVELRDGSGKVATQEQNCRDYANAQGYAVTSVFTDAGVSGGTAKRPGLNALLEYLETLRDRDVVVVMEDSARLARDVRVLLDLSERIRGTGARLEFCDQKSVATITVPARIQVMGTRRIQI